MSTGTLLYQRAVETSNYMNPEYDQNVDESEMVKFLVRVFLNPGNDEMTRVIFDSCRKCTVHLRHQVCDALSQVQLMNPDAYRYARDRIFPAQMAGSRQIITT